MSRRVVNEINRLNECHGFLRGIVALVGFRQTSIPFDRPLRFSDRGHYNLIGIGILGEYIGRIYEEVKGRPRFIVDAAHGFDGAGNGEWCRLEADVAKRRESIAKLLCENLCDDFDEVAKAAASAH